MSAQWPLEVRGLKTPPSDLPSKHLLFWTCRDLSLSYTHTEWQLLYPFPVTFPYTSHIPHTLELFLYSLSHKYPEPLALREAYLRLVLLSLGLTVLWINPLFAANLGISAIWPAAYQENQTWFGNTCIRHLNQMLKVNITKIGTNPYRILPSVIDWRRDTIQFSSVQFSRSAVSDSLRPHESQHARPPCPSPIPRVHSDSHPSSQWCHPAISSSVVPFSSCARSLPASESFPVSQLFAWGG